MQDRHQFQTWADVHLFAFAGNATLTLESRKSGQHFTYKISKPEGFSQYMVALLTGPNNEADYTYMGAIGTSGFHATRASRMSSSAPSWIAFDWFLRRMRTGGAMSSTMEIWHEGRCGRCGRTLTVPESLAVGLGPECSQMMGLSSAA